MSEPVIIPACLGLFYTGPALAWLAQTIASVFHRRAARIQWMRWIVKDPTPAEIELIFKVWTLEKRADAIIEFRELARRNPSPPSVGR